MSLPSPTKERTPMYYFYNPSKNRVQKRRVSRVIFWSRSILVQKADCADSCLFVEAEKLTLVLFGCTKLEEDASHPLGSRHRDSSLLLLKCHLLTLQNKLILFLISQEAPNAWEGSERNDVEEERRNRGSRYKWEIITWLILLRWCEESGRRQIRETISRGMHSATVTVWSKP